MGFPLKQNLTVGLSQPEVAQWESAAHVTSTVNNTVLVLGVLTFVLQLCLVLFCMLRCWRLDNRVREALKQPKALKLIAPPSCHIDIYKKVSNKGADSASTPVMSSSSEQCESITNSLFGPSIPWDLVQR